MRFKKRIGAALIIAMMLSMVVPVQALDSRAVNTRGNSTGNSIAYGMAAEENGKIFYVVSGKENVSGIYMTTSTPAKGKLVRKGHNLSELNAINGWVYFESADGYSRMKQDGSGVQVLTKDAVDYVNVVGGYIFYKCMSDGDDYGNLVRMKINGTGRVVISRDQVGAVNAFEKIVYYMNNSDDAKPYSVGIDGKNRKKISDQIMFRPCFAEDGFVYFTDYETRELYRAKYDGTGKKKLYDFAVNYPNYTGGYVYFSSGASSYRIKSGSTTEERLFQNLKSAAHEDYAAVAGGGIFRAAYNAPYPKNLYYGIKSKLTEIFPPQPAMGSATVDSLQAEIWSTTPYIAGKPGRPYVTSGKVTARVTGTKNGLATLKYGFGTDTEEFGLLVKNGVSYTVTIPITYGSSGISGSGSFSVSIGDSKRSVGNYNYGYISYGDITVN